MCEECTHKLNDKFNPKDFEDKIYERWMKNDCFKPSGNSEIGNYCIVMPPPNITGKLHMGHALDNTLQDILIRYKRMNQFNTLWVPGTDHAAIATEAKIVEAMKKEGITKDDLGRDGFLERAWEWKKEYGGTISSQLKKIGSSCDWSRERFTMDEGLTEAVENVFIKLYEKGLIYKGKRMINWCPNCNTSISDAEVEYEEEPTHLWHIKYQVTGTDTYITVATTRPETMLGDTAVAVHPTDERYKNLIGKTCILPIMNKEIPIIADEFVEKEFGTGCVKITPAHDPNDYQAGLKHNLEIIEVFDENWKMTDLVPEYKGLDLYKARELIVKKLEELGNLVKIEDYIHNVGKCYRCHNTVEPKISEQWFVKMKPLAEPAIEAVRTGKIKFVPERFDKIYYNWMENIQDWCISRQLWWGHRIPAYYCQECGETMVTGTKPEKCSKCGSNNVKQDEDTLDTWFSSALWPFSTLGWPNNTEELKTFYPTNTLVTAYDIIFFWVARMIFSGIEHMGTIPFDTVFIHGIIRDSQGRKMSKSLGNGVDPLEVIDKYGTDALRFSLVLGTSPGNDIRYTPEKLESAANFANKLWNAAKFIKMNIESEEEILEFRKDNYNEDKNIHNSAALCLEDKWILNKLDRLITEVNKNIDKYELGMALQKIYDFAWDEFCDWYIEIVKPRLYNKECNSRTAAIYTLNTTFKSILKLLHPFMPFVTTEIYDSLVKYENEEELMLSKWPKTHKEFLYESEERFIEDLKEVITGIRNTRAQMNVHPSKKSKLIFITKDNKENIEKSEEFIKKLGFADNIEVLTQKKEIPANAVNIVTNNMEIFIPFEDLVDIKEEIERLEKEKSKILVEKEKTDKMLSNPGFIEKAPEAKVKEEKIKLEKFEEMIKTLEDRITSLNNM